MVVSVTPQAEADIANLLQVYRLEGSYVNLAVVEAELGEILADQEDALAPLKQWFSDVITAYDFGYKPPQCPIDPTPKDELPEPKIYGPLKKVLDRVKIGKCELPESQDRQTQSLSPPPAGPSRAARKRLPDTASKGLPAHAAKRASKLPAGSESDADKGEDDEHQEPDDDDDGLPVEEFNVQAHNPAMILDPTTHIRRGTMRSQPIMASGSFSFWVEKQITREPAEATDLWPRTITNYEFVNDKGAMVSVALGQPVEPLYLVGIAGTIVGQYESSHRLMAGYWEFDETSKTRSPTEVLWVKVKITEITSGKYEWFRLGRSLALCAWSEDAVYVLQSAAIRYENRLQCSTVEPKKFTDAPVRPSSRKPAYMDDITWNHLQQDVVRFKQAGLALVAPKPPVMSIALRKRLESEGFLAQAEWALAVVDKQVKVLGDRFKQSKAKSPPFALDTARKEQGRLQGIRTRANADRLKFGNTVEPPCDDKESEYGDIAKRRKTRGDSNKRSAVQVAQNAPIDVDPTPPSSPALTPAPSDVDAAGEPDSTLTPPASDIPGGDQQVEAMDLDVPSSSAPSHPPATPAMQPGTFFGALTVSAGLP
ncbi:hypothetical protein FRC08_009005 [Ceratobasidium sp. 394]|nr:hypothetical protein FRC08_009005 [Ceratobasidium sp. 394]KAG9101793.1 hypothetical protein FS749_003096 [Ceratobasidium sp. UAMH 11750]